MKVFKVRRDAHHHQHDERRAGRAGRAHPAGPRGQGSARLAKTATAGGPRAIRSGPPALSTAATGARKGQRHVHHSAVHRRRRRDPP